MTDTPAFPSSPTVGANGDLMRPVDIGCEGMSLRDYFAAKAMQVILPDSESRESCAGRAYAMADAMLAERAKT